MNYMSRLMKTWSEIRYNKKQKNTTIIWSTPAFPPSGWWQNISKILISIVTRFPAHLTSCALCLIFSATSCWSQPEMIGAIRYVGVEAYVRMLEILTPCARILEFAHKYIEWAGTGWLNGLKGWMVHSNTVEISWRGCWSNSQHVNIPLTPRENGLVRFPNWHDEWEPD